MQILRTRNLVLSVLALVLVPLAATAAVTRVEVTERSDLAGGRSFGAAGPYEAIRGKIWFALDPGNPYNHRIVDLGKAPRDAEGRVEAWTEFLVLRPKQGVASVGLVEVSNRGGKAVPRYFQNARAGAGSSPDELVGDALLLRQGLALIWLGWQFDVPRREGLLRLHVPIATDNGATIEGLVRSDWTVDRPAASLGIAHRNHIPYPVADASSPDNVLTVRDGRLAPRQVIERSRWRFAREQDGQIVDDAESIWLEGGFQAGKIYEFVYRARDPRVVGMGLAAIRDVISYAKYDPDALFPVRAGIAFGVSQTGRFLRHFLYQGFNVDEAGRQAYDGLFVHSAGGGRGSFNHRFAQPSRDAHRYSAFFYPTDIFPFASSTVTDPETGIRDGLYAATDADHLPKVFYTNSGYEYWGRAAALIHTTPDGAHDLLPDAHERIYHLSSGQHFVSPFPPPERADVDDSDAYRGNPLDFLVTLRALMVDLVEWVRDGTEPPPPSFPKIADGTLVSLPQVRFPAIPGVQFPHVAHEAYRADYGPRFRSEGIIDLQPPQLGEAYPVRVPQVDALGNEVAGLSAVEILSPLATYAPWNLRVGYPAATEELTDFLGTYVPLPWTDARRAASGDPRPSVQSLYPTEGDYLAAASRAAAGLVRRRVLLPEDLPRVLRRAQEQWDWLASRAHATTARE